MTTLVIGAGLAGIATAKALQDDGHDVTVLETLEGVALETSFANGGMLTPSLPEPWNGPGIGRQLLASLGDPLAPVKLTPAALPSLLGWGIRFVRNSTRHRYLRSSLANYALATLSLERTLEATARLGLEYQLARSGSLCLYRSQPDLESRWALCLELEQRGLAVRRLDPADIPGVEPAIAAAVADRYCGAIWLPDDARGDAHRFCRELAARFEGEGGTLCTGCGVRALTTGGRRVEGVETSGGFVAADRVVVAAGAATPGLLRTAGLSLPIRPARGYSLTFDIENAAALPAATLVDEHAHVVVGCFGRRLRAVGAAEFAGFDKSIPPRRIDHLYDAIRNLLPATAARLDRRQGSEWAGLRPMSADGRPFIGPSAIDGLFVNAGHGALGWTQAMGSAALLADLVAGREPPLDPTPYRLQGRD